MIAGSGSLVDAPTAPGAGTRSLPDTALRLDTLSFDYDPFPIGLAQDVFDAATYAQMVDCFPTADVYAWTIRDRLPTIQIPLKPPDQDLQIDLAPVFETAFARGRYTRRLRYGSVPGIPKSAEDLKWCADLAQQRPV